MRCGEVVEGVLMSDGRTGVTREAYSLVVVWIVGWVVVVWRIWSNALRGATRCVYVCDHKQEYVSVERKREREKERESVRKRERVKE